MGNDVAQVAQRAREAALTPPGTDDTAVVKQVLQMAEAGQIPPEQLQSLFYGVDPKSLAGQLKSNEQPTDLQGAVGSAMSSLGAGMQDQWPEMLGGAAGGILGAVAAKSPAGARVGATAGAATGGLLKQVLGQKIGGAIGGLVGKAAVPAAATLAGEGIGANLAGHSASPPSPAAATGAPTSPVTPTGAPGDARIQELMDEIAAKGPESDEARHDAVLLTYEIARQRQDPKGVADALNQMRLLDLNKMQIENDRAKTLGFWPDADHPMGNPDHPTLATKQAADSAAKAQEQSKVALLNGFLTHLLVNHGVYAAPGSKFAPGYEPGGSMDLRAQAHGLPFTPVEAPQMPSYDQLLPIMQGLVGSTMRGGAAPSSMFAGSPDASPAVDNTYSSPPLSATLAQLLGG